MLDRLLPRRARRDLFEPSYEELREDELSRRVVSQARLRRRALVLWAHCLFVHFGGKLRWRPRRPGLRPPNRRGDPSASAIWQDLRYAARALAATPGFTLVAALTLGLGVGANAAMFSVVDAFLFRDLGGVRQPNRLVWLMTLSERTPLMLYVSFPNFRDIRDHNAVFDDMLAYTQMPVSLGADDRTERIHVEIVSANYFDMLGIPLVHGSGFPDAQGDAAGSGPVVVLTHGYWQRRFGGEPEIVGAVVRINGAPYTVVGITSPEYQGVETVVDVEAYLPLSMINSLDTGTIDPRTDRAVPVFKTLGRLADGVSVQQAQQAMAAMATELERLHPDDNRALRFRVFTEKSGRPAPSVGGQFAPVAMIFMGMVGLVLMIASANVANLVLARAAGRDRELAVRVALGAGRLRVIRQLVSESLLLGLLGGATGWLFAWWSVQTLRAMVAGWQLGNAARLPIDADLRLLVFACLVAVTAGLLTGLFPAIVATGQDPVAGLRGGGRSSQGPGKRRLRAALVAAQVATSLVLLVTASLFVRSLRAAESADLGLIVENLLLASIDPDLLGYDHVAGQRLYADIAERLPGLPGVEAAAVGTSLVFSPRSGVVEVLPEGGDPQEWAGAMFSVVNRVTPQYLRAAGTRLLRGRDLSAADRDDSIPVALVSETHAATYWPGEDALGKRFSYNGPDGPWVEVVGIVEDGKYLFVVEPPTPAFYVPVSQDYSGAATVYVRTLEDPDELSAALRAALAELDPNLPVFDVMPMQTYLSDGPAFLTIRLAANLVAAFGLLGAALAAVGLYGVVAYSVSQRQREFGIRLALGAEPRGVLRLVLRQGLALTFAGLACGAAAALLTSRVVAGLLFETGPYDPASYAAVIVLLLGVAVVASAVPAWRATRVDPGAALRQD